MFRVEHPTFIVVVVSSAYAVLFRPVHRGSITRKTSRIFFGGGTYGIYPFLSNFFVSGISLLSIVVLTLSLPATEVVDL